MPRARAGLKFGDESIMELHDQRVRENTAGVEHRARTARERETAMACHACVYQASQMHI